MLKQMRTGAKSTLIKFTLFGLLLLAMAGLAMMDVQGNFRSGAHGTTVATIDGKKMGIAEFNNTVEGVLRQRNIPRDQAYATGLIDQILENEIYRRLVNRAAADYGLRIDDVTAAKQVREIVAPMALEKKISEAEALQTILRSFGLTEQILVNDIKNQMATEQLTKALMAGAVAPKQLIDDALRFNNETRRGSYITLTAPDAGKAPTPTEEEVKKLYQDSLARYMEPEYRTIGVLVLDAASLGLNKKPTDEDIRKYYDKNIAEYSEPERRTVSQVVVKSGETKLTELLTQRVRETKDPKKVADYAGENMAKFVRGTYAEADMPVELSEGSFKAKEGDVLTVDSPLGQHILYIEKVIPASAKKFDEVKDKIAKDLSASQASDLLADKAGEVDDMVAGGSSLEDIATKLDLKTRDLTNIDKTGKDKKGDKVKEADFPAFDKLLTASFALDQGEVSQLIETPSGEYLLAEVRAITPAQAKPLDQVRADVVANWTKDKIGRMLDDKASKLVERMKMGEDIEKTAASLNKKVQSTGMVKRGAPDNALERGIVSALFALDRKGDVTTVNGEQAVYILSLAERKAEAASVKVGSDADNVRDLIERSMKNSVLAQLRDELMVKYKVSINHALVKSTYEPKEDQN